MPSELLTGLVLCVSVVNSAGCSRRMTEASLIVIKESFWKPARRRPTPAAQPPPTELRLGPPAADVSLVVDFSTQSAGCKEANPCVASPTAQRKRRHEVGRVLTQGGQEEIKGLRGWESGLVSWGPRSSAPLLTPCSSLH